MARVDSRQIIIERLVQATTTEASKKNKEIKTIDPVIRTAKRIFPYYSDKEIQDFSISALRVILNGGEFDMDLKQSSLLTHI
jgi:hypothetical protein